MNLAEYEILERDVVLLREVQVLIAFTDVHVHQLETLFHDRSRSAFMQRPIEDMAVVTPVAAKDQHN